MTIELILSAAAGVLLFVAAAVLAWWFRRASTARARRETSADPALRRDLDAREAEQAQHSVRRLF